MNIGEIITRRRKELGMSQRDLANACDYSASFICQLEKNALLPSLDSLKTIAAKLNISAAAFLEPDMFLDFQPLSKDALITLVNEALRIRMLFVSNNYVTAAEDITQFKALLRSLSLDAFDYLCDYFHSCATLEIDPGSESAYAALKNTINALSEKGLDDLFAVACFKMARVASIRDSLDTAADFLNKTLYTIEKAGTGQSLLRIRALLNLSALTHKAANPVRSLETNYKALEFARSLPELTLFCNILNNSGYYSLCLNDLTEAETTLTDALFFARLIDDDLSIANTTSNLGLLEIRKGLTDSGIEKLKVSLPYYQRQNRYNNIAITYFELAAACIKLGNYIDAMTYCRDAFKIARKHGLKSLYAAGYHSLGLILKQRGKTRWALKALAKAAELYSEHGETGKLPEVYTLMSEIWLDSGDTGKVREYLQKTREVQEKCRTK